MTGLNRSGGKAFVPTSIALAALDGFVLPDVIVRLRGVEGEGGHENLGVIFEIDAEMGAGSGDGWACESSLQTCAGILYRQKNFINLCVSRRQV
jgi:hypothetical protein